VSAEHDDLKRQAAMTVQAYQRGRDRQAPTAFDALYFIIDSVPDQPTGWLVLGWITGVFARERATFLPSEYDEDADAWYVKVSDKDVSNTTEVVANLYWTRTGELVGIELLPGAQPTPQPEEHLTKEELAAFRAKLKQSLEDAAEEGA
jgi:uncharacterized protein YuzE